MTHGAKNGGSFSEMMGPSIQCIKLTTVDIYLHTDTDNCMHKCIFLHGNSLREAV